MSTVKRVLIHCVSETTVQKAITTRSLGLNHSETSSCHVTFRFSDVSVGWGAREGIVELSESKSLSLDDYDLDDWQPTDTCPCCSYFCGFFISQSDCIMKRCIYLGNCSITLAPRGDGTAEGGRGRKVRPKRKHWLRDKQKPAAKWKEANPSLEKAKDREVFVDRLIQHNLPL